MSELRKPVETKKKMTSKKTTGDKKTIDDIYALPEGKHAELIDGVIYDFATPSRLHQDISGIIYSQIRNHIEDKGKKCSVYYAPFAVFLQKDKYNYFEPDISVICDPDKLEDDGCHGAPDWVIEIVSPSSIQMDYYRKRVKYEAAGVRLYWIVDPAENLITVYDFEHDDFQICHFGDAIPVALDPEWSITIPKDE